MTAQPVCALSHRQRRPLATVGKVCEEHMAMLRDLLAEIEELYDALPVLAQPLATAPAGNPETKRTKAAHSPAPINLALLALFDPATHAIGSIEETWFRNGGSRPGSNGIEVPPLVATLQRWSDRVVAEHSGAGPSTPDVPGLVAHLRRHIEGIAAADWLVEFEREIRLCRSGLLSAVGEAPIALPIARCPYCGGVHTHGFPDDGSTMNSRHRVSHCVTRHPDDHGYFLVDADEVIPSATESAAAALYRHDTGRPISTASPRDAAEYARQGVGLGHPDTLVAP